MYVTSTLRRVLLFGGASLLAAFALIAWTHRPEPVPTQAANTTNSAPDRNPEPVDRTVLPSGVNRAAASVAGPMNAYGEPLGTSREPLDRGGEPRSANAPVVYGASPFAPSDREVVPPAEAAPPAPPARLAESVPPEPIIQNAAAPVYRRTMAPHRHRYYRRAHRRVVVVKRRPFRRSAEIVAGSAAGGALIGGLAGGAKGAGIGALAAGSGGYVYDRLTHKKRVVVTR